MTGRDMRPPGGDRAARESIAGQYSDTSYLSISTPADKLLERLERVQDNGRDRWMARCPAHDDRSPSLSVREVDDGRVLVHCFTGCSASDVVHALGLGIGDLFEGARVHHHPARRRRRRPPREVLDAVSHALSVVTLADSDLARGEMLDNDSVEALDKALAVLAKEARQ